MKVLAILFVLVACACHAQDKAQLALLKAQTYGAQFDVRIRVIDDEGIPVEGAKCEGWAYIDRHKDNGYPHSGITDSNGVVRISGKCGKWVSVALTKTGYYMSQDEIRFKTLDPDAGSARWHPYAGIYLIVLKRVCNPLAMNSSRGMVYYPYPPYGQWAGFDLQLMEWVAPLGKGMHEDVAIRIERMDTPNGYQKTMEVSFTNNLYGGAYLMKTDRCSEMTSVYVANTNADYRSSFAYAFGRGNAGYHKVELKDGEYLVFRTRTIVNDKGELLSAHYGKIYGNWRFSEKGGMAIGKIVFNPNPNDPNLEDLETAERSRRYLRQLDEKLKKECNKK